ncbi:unnamed protein product [Mytilus edulis]|uniref:Uncharacterized protein n=1 Tax=Mytilus edulis TaxID=6550 RepID=A0A8S3UK71_MYTED|nr:unnamed protein product [Mytilus edulis]
MVALPTKNIDNLTLTLQKRINTKIYDKIRVFKSDGSKDFEIKDIGGTFDVVFIGDDSIAVTSGESNKINIIDLKTHKLKKSIKVDSYTGGVTYKNGHLIYCAREKGIQMLSLNNGTITNVSSTKLPDYAYVTTFGDKLIYTNRNNHSVTCCDYHGNILWTFCDQSLLLDPAGISVDNDGNVYVAGYLTGNVVVISPDGQRCRQILTREDGLSDPWTLHYDISTNELLVANESDEAFLRYNERQSEDINYDCQSEDVWNDYQSEKNKKNEMNIRHDCQSEDVRCSLKVSGRCDLMSIRRCGLQFYKEKWLDCQSGDVVKLSIMICGLKLNEEM